MSRIINYPKGGPGVPITNDYTVFVDESFDGLLGLSKPDGFLLCGSDGANRTNGGFDAFLAKLQKQTRKRV